MYYISTMKIFKSKSDRIELWEFRQWLGTFPETFGTKIGISWKVKKRRKLRSYTVDWNTWECDCCGIITSVNLTKGGRSFKMDNHFGPCTFYLTSL